MAESAQYSFDLSPGELDSLRSHLEAAQRFHLDRAREFKGMRAAADLGKAIAQAESEAANARALWALFAGVRSARCEGHSPVGHHSAKDLLSFLDGC